MDQSGIKARQLPAWYRAVMDLRENANSDTVLHAADFLCLVLSTGQRRHEALTVHWQQVDLEERTFRPPEPKKHEPLTLSLSN